MTPDRAQAELGTIREMAEAGNAEGAARRCERLCWEVLGEMAKNDAPTAELREMAGIALSAVEVRKGQA